MPSHLSPPQLHHARRFSTKEPLSVDHVEFLLQAIVRPSHDQLKALRALFSDFDGEKIIQTGGVLNTLEPHVQRVLVDLAAAFSEDAKNFSVKQCANILSTMVLLGHFDTTLKDAIVDRLLPEIEAKAIDPEILGSICYSVGVGGYSDHAFFKALEKFVVENSDAFSTRALSKVLWMFSRVDYNSDEIDATLGKMVDRVLKENDTVTEDLAYGIWACADHEIYADRLTARIMKGPFDKLSTFSATAIAKLAFGISHQQADDDEAYSAITRRATEIADDFFPRDIAKLLWALGNINFADRALLKALEPCIIRHLNKFNHNELDMIVTAYNNFGLHNNIVVQVADQMVCTPR